MVKIYQILKVNVYKYHLQTNWFDLEVGFHNLNFFQFNCDSFS